MDLDFAGLYQSYTNFELLKIIRHPEKFQEQAVAAADAILKTRTVTDNEREAAGFVIIQTKKITNPDTDVLTSFNPDAAEARQALWFNIIFLLITLYYLWLAYSSADFLYRAVKYNYSSFYTIVIAFLYILIIPLSLVSLYKKKQIGWILILAETFSGTVLSIFNLIHILSNEQNIIIAKGMIFLLIATFIRPLIAIFLLNKKVVSLFGINEELKKKVLIGIVAGSLVIAVCQYIVSSGTAI